MRHVLLRLRLAGLALAWVLIAAPASAQLDLTGSWTFNVEGNDVTFDFVQVGTVLTATSSYRRRVRRRRARQACGR